MPEAAAKEAQLKDTPETAVQPAKPAGQASLSQCWRESLHRLLAWFLQLLLLYFAELQDAFLAIPAVRRVVAFSLTPNCSATVLAHLIPPSENRWFILASTKSFSTPARTSASCGVLNLPSL